MIVRLILSVSLLFAVGSLLIAFSHRRNSASPRQRRNDWIKYTVFLIIVGTILTCAAAGQMNLVVLLGVILIVAAFELGFNLRRRRIPGIIITVVSLGIIIFCLGHLILFDYSNWFPTVAFLFLVVSVTDSYAQLTGRIFGRHRLCPVLSPGKTVEGALGGILASTAAAVLFHFLQPEIPVRWVILLALIISIAAMLGDLAFSALKRLLGIKDFSRVLPGHGGVLDRFDSLIIASPVFYWSLKAVNSIRGVIS